jgi:predicted  nucleic acid-binding Zn-ribbon protein
VNNDEDFAREIQSLEKKLQGIEALFGKTDDFDSILAEHSSDPESLSQILKRINAVQDLVDQIEIEIDKLEMRVSAIEHMGFRLRAGGQ